MKLLTFDAEGGARPGLLIGTDRVLDIVAAAPDLTGDMLALIAAGAPALDRLRALAADPPAAALCPLAGLRLLAPIPRPARNVFCVGRNYLEHVAEGDRVAQAETKLPEWPQFFTKPPQAVIGPGAAIPSHAALTRRLDYEVELAIVIGTRGVDIPEDRALEHVLGATIANDITARDVQRRHGQWFKGKGLDRSCPLGPWIVTRDELDPTDTALSMHVNGDLRQSSRTGRMIFSIPRIVALLSQGMALEPGDIILTGTPEGVGFAMDPPRYLQPGDRLEARIEGIGALENPVVAG
jgi:2-keto-4-pentenoate hydratase/2-oxohepta-3-ene-1,7-dioic acid hydratase in catechol pathway